LPIIFKNMAQKQTPKRVPAFALEILTNHPLALTLPSAAFGMLCRLIFHFILTECRPIPPDGDNLRGIMRAHRSTWTEHKKDILAVFQDLAPQLEAAEKHYKQRRAAVTAMGEKGRAAQRLRALSNKPPRPITDSTITPSSPKRAPVTPTAEPIRSGTAWR
jgi:hypothetical protein